MIVDHQRQDPVSIVLPDSPSRKQRSEDQIFRHNLFLTILIGTLASAWILLHTGWFPAIGGLLALGGLFSWIAFVSKALPEKRMEAIQEWFDSGFLAKPRATAVLLLLLLAGGVASLFFGSVHVESAEESSERVVFTAKGASPYQEDGERLAVGGEVRAVIPATFWSPAAVRVKVKGYPERTVSVRPPGRTKLLVPSSFLRPALLLRPTPELIRMYKHSITMQLFLNNKMLGAAPFTGHSMWVGCDEDVEIPELYQSLWRIEMKGRESLLRFLLYPASFSESMALKERDEVAVQLVANGQPYGERRTFPVRAVRRWKDFPQIEILDVPMAETEERPETPGEPPQ